jgi:hypothetical protein
MTIEPTYARRTGPLPKLTDRLALGDGLSVSPFCLGMVDEPSTVSAAYEAGINFFFVSADMHWPLYESTRQGLRTLLRDRPSVRDEIVVASVSYTTQPEFCWYPYQELLDEVRELGHLDVTIAGGAYRHELKTRRRIYEAQRQQKYKGVRAVGVTFHDRMGIVDSATRKVFDILFVRYNPDHVGARAEVFARLPKRRKNLLFNFKSTSGFVRPNRIDELGIDTGFWRPEVTDYYRFALTPAAMDGILCALTKPSHVGALVEALDRGPLDEEEEQYLVDLSDLDAGRAELGAADEGGGDEAAS